MKHFTTKGTCAKSIDYDIKDGILTACNFNGGCPGNAMGVCKLAIGKPIGEIISLFKGINCANKGTSCPDQLARALETDCEKTE